MALGVTFALRISFSLVLTQMVYIPNANTDNHTVDSNGEEICPISYPEKPQNGSSSVCNIQIIIISKNVHSIFNAFVEDCRRWQSIPMVAAAARFDIVVIFLGIYSFRDSWRYFSAEIWSENCVVCQHIFKCCHRCFNTVGSYIWWMNCLFSFVNWFFFFPNSIKYNNRLTNNHFAQAKHMVWSQHVFWLDFYKDHCIRVYHLLELLGFQLKSVAD